MKLLYFIALVFNFQFLLGMQADQVVRNDVPLNVQQAEQVDVLAETNQINLNSAINDTIQRNRQKVSIFLYAIKIVSENCIPEKLGISKVTIKSRITLNLKKLFQLISSQLNDEDFDELLSAIRMNYSFYNFNTGTKFLGIIDQFINESIANSLIQSSL